MSSPRNRDRGGSRDRDRDRDRRGRGGRSDRDRSRRDRSRSRERRRDGRDRDRDRSSRKRHSSPNTGKLGGSKRAAKKPKVNYKAVIRGYDDMSEGQRMRARMNYDIRRTAAFDHAMNVNSDEEDGEKRWERIKLDREVDVEETTEDLPETPLEALVPKPFKETKASIEADGFRQQDFHSSRYLQQFKAHDIGVLDHEAAIFGNTAHHSATAVHSARSEDASVAVPTPSPVQPATVGSTAEDEAKGVAVAGGEQTAKKKPKWQERLQAKRAARAAVAAAGDTDA